MITNGPEAGLSVGSHAGQGCRIPPVQQVVFVNLSELERHNALFHNYDWRRIS
jgi:hypothetical protein